MKHVTAAIIFRQRAGTADNEYLLVRTAKDLGRYTGYYSLPGGHVEPGEDDRTALVREIREELDLPVNPVSKIDATAGDVGDLRIHWWLCEADCELVLEDETTRFLTLSEMKDGIVLPASIKVLAKFEHSGNV
jgi:8-oxo-dGTP pyrophosphatase MutT (NUDIX family)